MNGVYTILAFILGAACYEQKDNIKHYWDKLLDTIGGQ